MLRIVRAGRHVVEPSDHRKELRHGEPDARALLCENFGFGRRARVESDEGIARAELHRLDPLGVGRGHEVGRPRAALRREGDRLRFRGKHEGGLALHHQTPGYEPPSTPTFWPEMNPACTLQSHAHAAPNSSGVPRRFAAMVSAISA